MVDEPLLWNLNQGPRQLCRYQWDRLLLRLRVVHQQVPKEGKAMVCSYWGYKLRQQDRIDSPNGKEKAKKSYIFKDEPAFRIGVSI